MWKIDYWRDSPPVVFDINVEKFEFARNLLSSGIPRSVTMVNKESKW